MNNKIKMLNKAYKKRFKKLNKTMPAAADSGLLMFIEHLKYLRDLYIITHKTTTVIASINAAIVEFEAYKKSQKEFHLNNFCEFIKLNIKEWLMANDSI